MNARRLHERFCAKIRPNADGVVYCVAVIGLVCAVLRLGFLLTRLGEIGPPHSISSTFTTRIVAAEVLNK